MMLYLALFLCLPFFATAAPAALEAKSDSDSFVKVVDFDSLPLNYHDEENEEELVGDKIFHKYEKIDKETDDITGDTILSEREVIEEDDDDFPERRLCLTDGNCGNDEYCSSLTTLKCQQCRIEDAECSRNVECCLGYLCVWGKCTAGISRGEAGTICAGQHDCDMGLCCTKQIFVPFAVCTPLLTEGDLCHQPKRVLMGLTDWNLVLSVPPDFCPCGEGLTCTSKGLGLISVCERSEQSATGIDYTGEKRIPLLKSIVRRDENLYYYPGIPPQSEERGRVVGNLPPMVFLHDENEVANAVRRMSEDVHGTVDEGKAFSLGPTNVEEKTGLSQSEYKELKRLADDIGLHFRPEYF